LTRNVHSDRPAVPLDSFVSVASVRTAAFFLAAGAVCLCLTAPVSAQAPQNPPLPVGPLSLAQVLELAEARSEAVAAARAGIARAEGEQVRARSALFPQLSVSASYDRALASEFEGVFDEGLFGEPPMDGEAGEDGGFEDLPFGRENTWRASLSLSQELYTGGRTSAQRAIASAGQESAGISLTTARGQLLFEVTQAYYDAALSDRLVAIAEASVEQAAATLRQTQAGFEAGTQPEFEVLRARVARDNQTPVVIRQRVNRDVALLRLKQLLDVPPDYDLRLADSLGDETAAPPPMFAEQVLPIENVIRSGGVASFTLQTPQTLPDRAPIEQAMATVSLREASLRLAEAQKRPNVSLTSTYARIGYPTGALPLFDRTNWSVGANVTLPLLTGGRQRGDEAVARAELTQAQAQLQQVQEQAAVDTRSAWAELLAARAAWDASAGTVEQAARAYEIADVRYRAGVSTQLELSDSRLLLQQAEANRAQAARDLQVARARVALLPMLPIGVGGGLGGAPAPVTPQTQPPTMPSSPQQPGAGVQIRNAALQGPQSQAGTR
jgi:outer membrane protein TolC